MINHLMFAAVVKLNSVALFSRVHLLHVLIFPRQDVLMNSAGDAAVRQDFLCGIEKSLTSVS